MNTKGNPQTPPSETIRVPLSDPNTPHTNGRNLPALENRGASQPLKSAISARVNQTPHELTAKAFSTPRQVKNLNPLDVEGTAYANTYYNTLEQGTGFHKETGYFTQFASRNKILNDQYKIESSPKSNHSRYISKPVFFTTLQSKNILSEVVTMDHSILLEATKTNTSTGEWARRQKSQLESLKKPDEMTKSRLTAKGAILPSLQQSGKGTERERAQSTSYGGISSPIGMHSRSNAVTESPSNLDKWKDYEKNKKKFNPAKLKDSHSVKEFAKYHTREMAEALTNRHTEPSQVDPDQYYNHKSTTDYMVGTRIAVSLLDQDKKHLRSHPGSPQAYMKPLAKTGYRDPGVHEEIHRFEENLLGWIKSVPNFGKQRWTYAKDWEFSII